MRFKKVVSIGLTEEIVGKKYWDMVDTLCENRVLLPKDDDRIDAEINDADCLLVWFNGADKNLIDKAPNLKYIGVFATGFGKIDVGYAQGKGISVANIPGYSTEGVAELVFAVLLENIRDISRAKTESRQSRTSESGFTGKEIKGKDFGVIGLGKIGSRVAELAKAFGANVYYFSRTRKPEFDNQYTFEALDELVKHCDFLSVNLALNTQTEGIFTKDRIDSIKPGTVLINTAPQEFFDLGALNSRLDKNDLTYIFDHSDPEDISDAELDKLRQHDNCIAYPVLGYITVEAQIALKEIFVNNMKAFLDGKPSNLVKL